MENNLKSRLDDLKNACYYKNIQTHTKFLNLSEQTETTQHLKGTNYILDGGFCNAERKICIFLSEYVTENDYIYLIRATKSKKDNLQHKDYLGSIMSLNIKRECIGDICLHEDGADIFVLKDISEFLLLNWEKAGRKSITLKIIDKNELKQIDKTEQIITKTIASMRLDAFIAEFYNLSRNSANDYIKSGKVSVNSLICQKNDTKINVFDKISIRGFGRSEILENLGESKKGKIKISIRK